MKKGQGLSMNMIVAAIIAILVLVIISVIFTGNLSKTSDTLQKCESKGGRCVAKASCGGVIFPESDLCEGTNVCCLTGAKEEKADANSNQGGEQDPVSN